MQLDMSDSIGAYKHHADRTSSPNACTPPPCPPNPVLHSECVKRCSRRPIGIESRPGLYYKTPACAALRTILRPPANSEHELRHCFKADSIEKQCSFPGQLPTKVTCRCLHLESYICCISKFSELTRVLRDHAQPLSEALAKLIVIS